MSQENVEIVGRTFDAFNRGGMDRVIGQAVGAGTGPQTTHRSAQTEDGVSVLPTFDVCSSEGSGITARRATIWR